MMYFTDYREMNNFSLDERNSVAAKINFQLTPYLYRIGLSPHIAGRLPRRGEWLVQGFDFSAANTKGTARTQSLAFSLGNQI